LRGTGVGGRRATVSRASFKRANTEVRSEDEGLLRLHTRQFSKGAVHRRDGQSRNRLAYHRFAENPNSFTARYGVSRLVYLEEFTDVNQAIAREKQLTSWRRAKKDPFDPGIESELGRLSPERRTTRPHRSLATLGMTSPSRRASARCRCRSDVDRRAVGLSARRSDAHPELHRCCNWRSDERRRAAANRVTKIK
jgi:hypothetical protein